MTTSTIPKTNIYGAVKRTKRYPIKPKKWNVPAVISLTPCDNFSNFPLAFVRKYRYETRKPLQISDKFGDEKKDRIN